MEQKFYICRHCGNIVAYVKGNGVFCCGEEMEELIPNSFSASKEKHIPIIEQMGNDVFVFCQHPMEEKHHIEWISLQTKKGNQRQILEVGGEPKAHFKITDDDFVEAAYAYCNLHFLWRS